MIRRCWDSSLVFCIAAALAALTLDAAESSGVPREFRQRVWTTDQGLPHNTVRAVLQTRDGYLWIATQRGLARFDGLKFAVFNHLKDPAFVSDDCTRLAEDSADWPKSTGHAWMGRRNSAPV